MCNHSTFLYCVGQTTNGCLQPTLQGLNSATWAVDTQWHCPVQCGIFKFQYSLCHSFHCVLSWSFIPLCLELYYKMIFHRKLDTATRHPQAPLQCLIPATAPVDTISCHHFYQDQHCHHFHRDQFTIFTEINAVTIFTRIGAVTIFNRIDGGHSHPASRSAIAMLDPCNGACEC